MAKVTGETHSTTEADYVLPRNEAERRRLDEQHFYLTLCLCENRLIYDQAVRLGPDSQILDAGTGSGSWIVDLSKQLPASTKLYGCDISSSNFPRAHPINVEFRVASVTSLPQEWSDKFDFVNQRFITAGLPGSDWHTAISELFRVLKPGGHIQLIEMDFLHTVNAGPHATRFLGLISELFAKRGLLFDCSRRLRGFAEAAGFVDVVADKQYYPIGRRAWGRTGQLGTNNAVGAMSGLASFMKEYGIVDSEEETSRLLDECVQEWDNSDTGVRTAAHVVCARKPEQVVI